MPRRLVLLVVVLALGAVAMLHGCANAPPAAVQAIQEGEPQVLNRECKLLGTVNGRSIFDGMSDDAKVKGAVANVREKAAAMGATHIYLMKAEVAGAMGIGEATARVYRCDPKPA